ncbi:MAG TPA: hypothetical protein VLE73_00140, partial [Candidatus Saccharimonadales bacterium]|nr:hypothetical protein [Candidatus Saccharimonadales bacterium]
MVWFIAEKLTHPNMHYIFKLMITTLTSKVGRPNAIIAIAAAVLVALVGIILITGHAASFFASADATGATLSGNASLVTDSTASSGKAVLFKAPTPTPPPPTPTPPPPTPTPTPPPSGGGKINLKIMPLGDSLTQGGVNANAGGLGPTTVNGYRLALLNLLSANYNIDYVGSWQVGDSQLADKDENGFSGACIMVSPCGGGTLYPQTAAWINSENPDLIIMQGGENDF